ncbi:MAG: hypothetical protein WC805_02660 [Patescibacteria group bacterium]|jgi:hypothetical protein
MGLLLLIAIGYGISMKIADLHNEHGFYWFSGADILFGIVWGIMGAALVMLGGPATANIMLAMNLAFLVRGRLDYLNHQIATTMIIITFLAVAKPEIGLLLTFYLVFVLFGSIKDRWRGKAPNRFVRNLYEGMLYYPVPAVIYSGFSGDWRVFWIFLFYTVGYDATKYIVYLVTPSKAKEATQCDT